MIENPLEFVSIVDVPTEQLEEKIIEMQENKKAQEYLITEAVWVSNLYSMKIKEAENELKRRKDNEHFE